MHIINICRVSLSPWGRAVGICLTLWRQRANKENQPLEFVSSKTVKDLAAIRHALATFLVI
jgi:hypothetical protein